MVHPSGACTGFGNPDCVHIVARFTDAHITFILLCCTRCGTAMVFGISIRRFGLVYGLGRFGVSFLSCVIVWCLSFFDDWLVES